MPEANRNSDLPIGFIGLGAMGMGMARRLLAAGFSVTGFDVRAAAVEAFVQAGGKAGSSPSETSRGAAVIVVMVVNARQADAVLFGEGGALESLPRGAAVMLSVTVPPSFARATGERLAASGHLLLDAPVCDSAALTPNQTMMTMAKERNRFIPKDSNIAECDVIRSVRNAKKSFIESVGMASSLPKARYGIR